MNILLCNDDGIESKGLLTLAEVLSEIADIYIVAPEGERSSFSHHLSIRGRVRYEERTVPFAKKAYALWGKPADCAHLGLKYLVSEKIDLVVSGINRGVNASTDIVYSGTVAAAREAFIYHVPAMALSRDGFESPDFYAAAKFGRRIALKYMNAENNADYFLNVNVPDLAEDQIKGIRICDRVGHMAYQDSYSHMEEDGIEYICINPSVVTFEGDENDLRIDMTAVRNGYVALSAMGNDHMDLDHMKDLKTFLL